MATSAATTNDGDASREPPLPSLGGAGKTLRVYTFSGGKFDSVMQLGVVHAMLVAGYEHDCPPDLITGISTGAINAVAFAEILQAAPPTKDKEEAPDPREIHAAQVKKFREVLEACREGPLQLLQAQLPDGYETNAQRSAENLKLPIHLKDERDGRDEAQRARSGLIRLINELLSITLPVREAVLITRLVLAIRESKECRGTFVRLWGYLVLWDRLVRNMSHLGLPIGRIALMLLNPWKVSTSSRPTASKGFGRWIERCRKWIGKCLWDNPLRAVPARKILFRRGRLKRRIWDFIRTGLGRVLILVGAPPLGIFIWVISKARSKLPTPWKTYAKDRFTSCLPEAWWRRFFSKNALQECVKTVLSNYALAKDLGDANALRQRFVELFDPDYFGSLNMEQVREKAIERSPKASGPDPKSAGPKRLTGYTLTHYKDDASEIIPKPLRVAIFAADIADSQVKSVPENTPVVDALMAATAIVPLFRAVALPAYEAKDEKGKELPRPPGTAFYIDGENVSADPLRPTIRFIQKRIDKNTAAVRIYSVTAFPISKEELYEKKEYRGLVDVILRSLELQRMQNALLERRLIGLYNKTIRAALGQDGAKQSSRAVLTRQGSHNDPSPDPFVAAKVVPIEADWPPRLNQKIAFAKRPEDRRALIDQAVADGCRATLSAWLHGKDEPLNETAKEVGKQSLGRRVSCRGLVKFHLQRINHPVVERPESDQQTGPGLSEICRSCRFFQERTRSSGEILKKLDGFDLPTGPDRIVPEAAFQEIEARNKKGTVSLLFSGGVFRGVYQLGVANALNILDLRPNVVAGASVGSITAALLAEMFRTDDEKQRKQKMLDLATTYLALDRLILTDRFYDFVRRLTLRGGEAEFSLRDVDLLLRRYDEGSTATLSVRARKTLAGLERLFYLSPFEFNQLVRLQRSRDYGGLFRLLLFKHIQELLDRNGASLEVLGAEPLILLLKEHLPFHKDSDFDCFHLGATTGRQIYLLSTVTNLTKGCLRTLGSPRANEREKRPVLRDGLLASSAFPGVFRPRDSWEIFPTSSDRHQYVDGGVMDNLPFDSVLQFLEEACKPRGEEPMADYARRPDAPHLIIAASLEPKNYALREREDLDEPREIQESWVRLRRRAKEIRYNRKIDSFVTAQDNIKEIWQQAGLPSGKRSDEPLDIQIVAVKPEWHFRISPDAWIQA